RGGGWRQGGGRWRQGGGCEAGGEEVIRFRLFLVHGAASGFPGAALLFHEPGLSELVEDRPAKQTRFPGRPVLDRLGQTGFEVRQ
ncbi:MAG TPA: hypothetical protein VGE37_05665, partial [Archangium sp.]